MKLEGSLDAFGLPDVFQLLAATRKTGGLRVRAADGVEGAVWFDAGLVANASADLSRPTLLRRVVAALPVDDAALATAVAGAVAVGAGGGALRALLAAGAVDHDAVSALAREHAVDAVVDLLDWHEGEFALDADETDPEGLSLGLPVDQLVTTAQSRATAWQELSASVPLDAVLRLAPVAEAVTADPREWALLALLDGRRTVADVVELAGDSPVTVLTALGELQRRGLAAPAGAEAGDARSRRLAVVDGLERPTLRVPLAPAPEPPPFVEAREDRAEFAAATDHQPGDPGELPDDPAQDQVQAWDEDAEAADRVDEWNGDWGPEPHLPPQPVAQPFVPPSERDVVPPRPEPFLPQRRPEHDMDERDVDREAILPARTAALPPLPSRTSSVGDVVGSVAMAPDRAPLVERDPSINRGLMLRLIAGVRGL
ncbi:MAG TPA: DUF4388 domain-containing protein [Motilibacteraceae bacterium]|nr:DUF4388 domain-containing protein [Motilibacteraceae bacterium]